MQRPGHCWKGSSTIWKRNCPSAGSSPNLVPQTFLVVLYRSYGVKISQQNLEVILFQNWVLNRWQTSNQPPSSYLNSRCQEITTGFLLKTCAPIFLNRSVFVVKSAELWMLRRCSHLATHWKASENNMLYLMTFHKNSSPYRKLIGLDSSGGSVTQYKVNRVVQLDDEGWFESVTCLHMVTSSSSPLPMKTQWSLVGRVGQFETGHGMRAWHGPSGCGALGEFPIILQLLKDVFLVFLFDLGAAAGRWETFPSLTTCCSDLFLSGTFLYSHHSSFRHWTINMAKLAVQTILLLAGLAINLCYGEVDVDALQVIPHNNETHIACLKWALQLKMLKLELLNHNARRQTKKICHHFQLEFIFLSHVFLNFMHQVADATSLFDFCRKQFWLKLKKSKH